MFVVPFARIFWDLWFTNRKLLVPSISLLSWKSKRKMGLLFWEWSMACFIVGKWIVAISVEQKPKSFCMIVHACVCSIQKEGFMSIKIWIGGFPMTSMTTFASKVLMPHPFSKTQVPDFPAWPTWAGEQRQGQVNGYPGGWVFSLRKPALQSQLPVIFVLGCFGAKFLNIWQNQATEIHASEWQGFFWTPPLRFFLQWRWDFCWGKTEVRNQVLSDSISEKKMNRTSKRCFEEMEERNLNNKKWNYLFTKYVFLASSH